MPKFMWNKCLFHIGSILKARPLMFINNSPHYSNVGSTLDDISDEDKEGLAYYFTHLGEDNAGFYEQELKRDKRRYVVKGDISQQYNDYNSWRNSSLAKDVDRVVNLIPEKGEIAVKDLRDVLTSSYAMTRDYADKVIKEAGTNDVRISARESYFDKSYDNIKLKKLG